MTEQIDVTDARPLAAFAISLEHRLGKPVTYEDPHFNHPQHTVHADGRTIPQGGTISVKFTDTDSMEQIISKAIEVYDTAGLPGSFSVEAANGYYHIIPNDTAAELLNASVKIKQGAYNGLQLLEEITSVINASGKMNMMLGTIPLNALTSHKVKQQPLQAKAREVMVSLLREMNMLLSWHLLNVPLTNNFVLNIHPVRH